MKDWTRITFHCLTEAVTRATEVTGKWDVTLSGDFGQDRDDDCGMGNEDYAILVFGNGTAVLTIKTDLHNAWLDEKNHELHRA